MIRVEISTSAPLFVEADADAFGQHFANMGDEDQVAVLTAMVEYMRGFPTQWDHIAIELEKDEHREVREVLRSVFAKEG